MRYGAHHARSTDALVWLLAHGDPVEAQETSAFLGCRMALLAAHRERCEVAVRGADVRRAVFRDRLAGRDFGALARSGTAALAQLLDEYPTFADCAQRFTDVLQRDDLSAPVTAWAQLARHAVLATEALASNTAWRTVPAQAWQVVVDIADTAQALTVLDRRAAENVAGLPAEWRSTLGTPAAEVAMAARHVGFLARSGPIDPGVDRILRRAAPSGLLPVCAVSDVVPALSATALLLDRRALSIEGLRRFALMQADIAHLSAELVGADAVGLRRGLAERDTRFRALAGTTARVASVGPSQERPVLAQTQEIGRHLLERRRLGRPLAVGDLHEIDKEQARVMGALATSVRRALESGRYLVVDDESVSLAWRRAEPGEEPAILRVARPDRPHVAARRIGGVLASDSASLPEEVHLKQGIQATDATDPRRKLRDALLDRPAVRRPAAPDQVPIFRL